jgi:hypothetical protein
MASPKNKGWNPYLAGVLSGILSIFSEWIAGKFFGASTTFVRSAGMIERLIGPERVAKMQYFIKEIPQIDWQWMFVVGIFIGSICGGKGLVLAKGNGEQWLFSVGWSPCLELGWPAADPAVMD